MSLNPARLSALLQRARRDVDLGLLPSCQIALCHRGEVVAHETFGDADPDTRYCLFSATKPFVAAVIWQLIGTGELHVRARVADVVPEFGSTGKQEVTIEQLLLHTAGFPLAPLGPAIWDDRRKRLERMATWRLTSEPGKLYEYHFTSAHWVLAEIIERITGEDYRSAVRKRIAEPLGLRFALGVPPEEQGDLAEIQVVGEEATPDELLSAFGLPTAPPSEAGDAAYLRMNEPSARAVGLPGGGGFARALDVALFYQALLDDTLGIWHPAVLADVTTNVRNSLPDQWYGIPASRTLGLLVGGVDGFASRRGMGNRTSPRSFGHHGAGGQLAWADPATGLSLGYLTNGMDRHVVRMTQRNTEISDLAALCSER